jgi:hypothetical protein
MRWGFTKRSADPKIRWGGFGYRHIVAKHGWGPTALARTEETLLTGTRERRSLGTDRAGRERGAYDEYTSNAANGYISRSGLSECLWRVVVEREPREIPEAPEQSQGMPMDSIITAFGKYARKH